ncbi:MAG: MSHA biogenesis protein MshP [Betaproteobacteria bacterium HGW-Betaproteobacteria-7]|jgi:MSHA biogenesis protein MshP|nr:MAG: MSHA biogenesis protein MshP [Betaproteobacteria bacterium HGW-Betaproteobacteria-7]
MKRNGQQGFGAIMAIVVLVILAALSAAMLRFGTVQQLTSAQDVLSARAWAAAGAGTEWGLHRALKGNWCDGAAVNQTLDLTAETGFRVRVACSSRQFNEGESAPGVAATVRVYRIDAVACNGAANCPDDVMATSPGYVERRRQVVASTN